MEAKSAKQLTAIVLLGLGMPFGVVRAQAADEVTIHSFGGLDGSGVNGLVADAAGVLYGTMYNGGTSKLNGSPNCHRAGGCGTIFRLAPPAAPGERWTFEVLYDFQGLSDGANPNVPPIVDAAGNLYGTAIDAGNATYAGVVWELSPAAPGGTWNYTVLHNFSLGSEDGWHPAAGLVMSSQGVLYGFTQFGGASGAGAAYSLASPSQSGQPWIETILASLDKHDGAQPTLTPLLTAHETRLLGLGGAGNSACEGCNGLFAVTVPPGSPHVGVRAQISQHDDGEGFGGPPMIGKDRVLYYTTQYGGAEQAGTVQGLSPPAQSGGTWSNKTIYALNGSTEGAVPAGGLLRDGTGSLFGTASQGAVNNDGTIFRLDPPAVGGNAWTLTVLHSFTGTPGSDTERPDGAHPGGQLVFGYQRRLYGLTGGGGRHGEGTVFMQVPR
jgi:uncharacterized repeat protein (TIGR03803 family)